MNVTAKNVSFIGISLALMTVLGILDTFISSAFPIPGVRIGLSNVVIIIILLKMGLPWGSFMCLLRSGITLLTRGVTAGIMSLSGGILSFAAVYLLLCVLKSSYGFSCIISSLLHIAGQITAACFITGSFFTVYYAPVLMPAAIVTGLLTGAVIESVIIKLKIPILYRKD